MNRSGTAAEFRRFIEDTARNDNARMVMLALFDHLDGLRRDDVDRHLNGNNGITFTRLVGGTNRAFARIYPGTPSLQFPHGGHVFDRAHLIERRKHLYRVEVSPMLPAEAVLDEAKRVSEFSYRLGGLLPEERAPRTVSVNRAKTARERATAIELLPYKPRPVPLTQADPFSNHDPEAFDRGNQKHEETRQQLAEFLKGKGFKLHESRSPKFDLAWVVDGALFVAEVKSLTATNERAQVRLGLGQVLDYRFQCRRSRQWRDVRAVLVLEMEPSESRFVDVCAGVDVTVAWPGEFARLLPHYA